MCVQDDDGFILWESKAILRYIAGKHKLESMYLTDLKARANCDLQMDFFGHSFYPLVGSKVLYPAVGFAGPDADPKATEVRPARVCSLSLSPPPAPPPSLFLVRSRSERARVCVTACIDAVHNVQAKFNEDIIPAMKNLLGRIDGPLMGGAKPNLADFAFFGVCVCVCVCVSVFVCVLLYLRVSLCPSVLSSPTLT